MSRAKKPKLVRFTTEMTEAQALAVAQMLKRQSWSCWRELAVSDTEAYDMRDGCDCVRTALADKGYEPR